MSNRIVSIDASYDTFGDGCIELTRTVDTPTKSKAVVMVLTPAEAAQAIKVLEQALRAATEAKP